MALFPEIIVGTYEEFLLGYEIVKKNNGEFELQMAIASHAHQASIRCVAAHKHLLASSGADEYINIFSMKNKKEVALVTPHAGTVTCVSFVPDGSHLVSASQDGSIAIVRCSDWRLAKIWKDAHKRANGVLGLSVHPSGKLLLSVGADNILRAWNLIKGRQAYAVNFGKKTSPGNSLNFVAWSENGAHYAVCIGQLVEIYSTETASIAYAINAESRISCVDFVSGKIILGRDDGRLELHDIIKKEKVLEVNGHEKRVKCARFFNRDDKTFLITADSMGCIKLWSKQGAVGLKCEAVVNADCRIVCLTLVNPQDFVKTEQPDTSTTIIEKPTIGTNELRSANKQVVIVTQETSPTKTPKKKKRKSGEASFKEAIKPEKKSVISADAHNQLASQGMMAAGNSKTKKRKSGQMPGKESRKLLVAEKQYEKEQEVALKISPGALKTGTPSKKIKKSGDAPPIKLLALAKTGRERKSEIRETSVERAAVLEMPPTEQPSKKKSGRNKHPQEKSQKSLRFSTSKWQVEEVV